MKRGDIVKIKRGIWKGHQAKITEVTSNGARVGVDVGWKDSGSSPYTLPFSLAVTSVELVAPR